MVTEEPGEVEVLRERVKALEGLLEGFEGYLVEEEARWNKQQRQHKDNSHPQAVRAYLKMAGRWYQAFETLREFRSRRKEEAGG